MTVTKRLFWPSTIVVTFVGALLLQNAFLTGSLECSDYDFPCDDGECIDSGLWCDGHVDCSDDSDEKYCRKSTYFISDPNKCLSTYFKCKDGPCIPMVGQCDGYKNCEDGSDEKGCPYTVSSVEGVTTSTSAVNIPTTPTDVQSIKSEMEGPNVVRFFTSLNVSKDPQLGMQEFFGLSFSGFSAKRNLARKWLLSRRGDDFGWGEETPRVITALYLSESKPTLKTAEIDMLMIKQLEMLLFLELSRNGTKPMNLVDLALYINALHLSCKNTKNFYGNNLVNILRNAVDGALPRDEFINPSIYLTLCINNATTSDDSTALQDILLSRNTTTNRIDMQALALLATACVFQKTNFLKASTYDELKKEFLTKLKIHGHPGIVFEAALVFQALQELKVTLTGLLDFILKHQEADGSFGDVLSTYLVLPILAGKSMVYMNNRCDQHDTSDLIPIEVLKRVNSKKMYIQYSLNYGVPPDVTQTLHMHVAEATSFFNIMRLAQDISPKYQFKLSANRKVPVVYSVGGIPNDVEKGLYWMLYKASNNTSESSNGTDWILYPGDIKQLILGNGDKVMFWYKPL